MKPKTKFMKVSLIRVERTDLICVGCGRFRTEWAILPLQLDAQDIDNEPIAGVHTKCIPGLHVRRALPTNPVFAVI
jgi:hypothetical protein